MSIAITNWYRQKALEYRAKYMDTGSKQDLKDCLNYHAMYENQQDSAEIKGVDEYLKRGDK